MENVEQLGPRQYLTGEGFLVCRDVVLARTGRQIYHATELPVVVDRADSADGFVSIWRDESEVFDPNSIQSFVGKPVVDEHPAMVVDPDNIAEHQIGTVVHVRRGEGRDSDTLVADLLVTSRRGIELVRGGKRAVSVGYDAVYNRDAQGRITQQAIRCNHIALVHEARCGPRCAIGDSKPLTRRTVMDDDDGGTMPLPEGISPQPAPIELRSGIPLGLSLAALQRAGGATRDLDETAAYAMGRAHPLPPSTLAASGGQGSLSPAQQQQDSLSRQQLREIAAADARRCREALQQINEHNRRAWTR